MRYVAAYLLAVLGGNSNPSNVDIEKILSSVGIEFDGDRVKKIIADLSGKDVEELMAKGREKLSSMPVGASAITVTNAAPTPGNAPSEEKKEEKKDEPEESDDDDMGFGLFD